MSTRVIRVADLRRQPWANGAGITRELLQWPGDSAHWQWRLSIAEVDRDAPFSTFPGVERILVLLSGGGIRLQFDDGRVERLDSPGAYVRFPGEAGIVGGPAAGATTDFNLMWRRDDFDADLELRQDSIDLKSAPGETGVVHVVTGQASTADGSQLNPGDTLVSLDDGTARSEQIAVNGKVIEIKLRTLDR